LFAFDNNILLPVAAAQKEQRQQDSKYERTIVLHIGHDKTETAKSEAQFAFSLFAAYLKKLSHKDTKNTKKHKEFNFYFYSLF
jgi:hypothetical protein